ncbi:hypothetical protein P8452_52904 [Trifolium repens]|nr:hypothetical protein P8452_52904 [Trifolium repens]
MHFLGDPVESSYVRRLASIRPQQLIFQDDDTSLVGHNNVSEIICTTNAGEYDIPTNLVEMGRTKIELVYFIWNCAMDTAISTQDISSVSPLLMNICIL